MDFVVPVLLVLSLIGNFFQHEKIDELKSEKEEAVIAANKNYDNYNLVVGINEENKDVIDELNERLKSCNSDLKAEVDKINGWKEADRLKRIAIKDLSKRLDDVDFGASCRMPDWVDFETGSNSIRSE